MRLTKADKNAHELKKLRARTATLEAAVVALLKLIEDPRHADAAHAAVDACRAKGDH